MNADTITYHLKINKEREWEFKQQLERVNDKLISCNLPIAELVSTEETFWVWVSGDNNMYLERYNPRDHFHLSIVSLLEIKLKAPIVKMGKYSIVSKAQRMDDGKLLVIPTGQDREISRQGGNRFKGDVIPCDHCGMKRRRNLGYSLYDGEEIITVGSTCLDLFVGFSVTKLIEAANMFISFADSYGEDSVNVGAGTTNAFSLNTFLCVAIEQIGADGYFLSRTKAREDGEGQLATADKTTLTLFDRDMTQHVGACVEKHSAEAQTIIDWVRAIELPEDVDMDDFDRNLKSIMSSDIINARGLETGLAASSITKYRRAMDLIAAREKQAVTSEWFGVEKERIELELKVNKTFESYGQYGLSVRYVMEDRKGNVVLWDTGAYNDMARKEGIFFKVKVTIKRHGLYGNLKQTHIARLVIIGEA